MSILALSVAVGLGKALNNTNTRLPGYLGSVHISAGNPDSPHRAVLGYTHIGMSHVAGDAGITTVGYNHVLPRYTLGFNVITQASYAATVWYNSEHPSGQVGDGTRYPNDGVHFSRSCRFCGGTISLDYQLTKRVAFRAEYIGLRHMNPTFQGVLVQVTYRIGE